MTPAEAADRFRTTLAGIRARMRHCGIAGPDLSEDDLKRLGALDEHLQAGRPIGEFKYVEEVPVEVVKRNRAAIRSTAFETVDRESFVRGLSATYQFLQAASDSNWRIPTSVVRELTGSTPRGPVWRRLGFLFVADGKDGTETAWRVESSGRQTPPSTALPTHGSTV